MSTVVGAILVVGITVVLAAIIGGFVFGIGDDLSNTQPQAEIDFSYDVTNDRLEIIHDGGGTINSQNTGKLELAGDIPSDMNSEFNITTSPSGGGDIGSGTNAGDLLMTSESSPPTDVGNLGDVSGLNGGDELKLIWVSNDGSTSNQMGQFVIPQ